MTTVYYIEKQFKFIYEERKLVGNTGERVIFTPAAKCLKALLERQGEVLSKDELISIGWEEAGPATSLNALYQTISHLRTSMDYVGAKEDILKTVKRVGFVIEPRVSVVLIVQEEREEEETSALLNSEKNAISSYEKQSGGKLLKEYGLTKRRNMSDLVILSLALIVFLLSIFFTLKTLIPDERAVFNNFQLYKEISGTCSVYVSWNSEPGKNVEAIYDLKHLNCQQFNRVYLTIWGDRPGTSGIFCHVNDEERLTFCKTKYFASHYSPNPPFNSETP